MTVLFALLRHSKACLRSHSTVNILLDQTAVDKAICHDLALKYKAMREAKFKFEAIKDKQNKRFFPGCDFRCCLHHQSSLPGEKQTEGSNMQSTLKKFLWITVIDTAESDMIMKDTKKNQKNVSI